MRIGRFPLGREIKPRVWDGALFLKSQEKKRVLGEATGGGIRFHQTFFPSLRSFGGIPLTGDIYLRTSYSSHFANPKEDRLSEACASVASRLPNFLRRHFSYVARSSDTDPRGVLPGLFTPIPKFKGFLGPMATQSIFRVDPWGNKQQLCSAGDVCAGREHEKILTYM